jgi:signal transduction histidine kinase
MAPRVHPPSRLGPDVRSAAFLVSGLVLYVALVYALVVLALGRLVGQTGSPNLLLSILATAWVAISFEPVQARLERAAARLFELRSSPYEVLNKFAASSGSDQLEDLPLRMAQLLAEGTDAAAAQVWLMMDNRPTLAATWPADDDAMIGTVETTPAGRAAPWRTLPVRDGGETLGLLSVREPDQRPLTPVEERLFAGLAAQAGLVLRSVRLRAQLSARLDDLAARAEELRASRERLIETQDDERRRLERDIHDGAQQNLVALAVNLRLADTLLRRSPARAAAVLGQQSEAAQGAIDNLTQLSRGIYPAVLADEGLVPALAAVSASSALPITLAADPTLRLPAGIAAALYFCCLEALQNAAKHSGATSIRVAIERTADRVRMTVRDDGRGFTVSDVTTGAGTANMRDRIDAVGGTFSITSATGHGTSVAVEIPLVAVAAGAS